MRAFTSPSALRHGRMCIVLLSITCSSAFQITGTHNARLIQPTQTSTRPARGSVGAGSVLSRSLTQTPASRRSRSIAETTLMAAPLPAIGLCAAACTIPTMLGFYRSEYGVSYAYGTAMALSGLLMLPSCATQVRNSSPKLRKWFKSFSSLDGILYATYMYTYIHAYIHSARGSPCHLLHTLRCQVEFVSTA
jgi:hypothetical protein